MMGRSIPLVIGDDWSILLAYKTKTKQPIDISDLPISVQIIRWDESATITLSEPNGRFVVTDPQNGKFAVGLERAATEMTPDYPTQFSRLAVTLGKPDGAFHTMPPLFLSVVKTIDLFSGNALGAAVQDPVTENWLCFEGMSPLVPTGFAPRLDFSVTSNNQYLPLI